MSVDNTDAKEDFSDKPGERSSIQSSETEVSLGAFETTNPRNFNPNKFRFVIHSIGNDETKAMMERINTDPFITDVQEQPDPLTQTDKFLKRSFISSSVIDQDHPGTWADQGVIFDVQRKNILLTRPHDAMIIPGDGADEELEGEQILPFQELLEQTNPNTYNEILVRASKGYPTIQLQGVFIKCGLQGKPFDETYAEKVRQLASTHHLPVITLQTEKPTEMINPDRTFPERELAKLPKTKPTIKASANMEFTLPDAQHTATKLSGIRNLLGRFKK